MNQLIKDFAHRALIVFARYPYVGPVKTRLASTLGAEWATKFYRSCAEWIFSESIRTCCSRYLFYVDDTNKEKMQEWAGPDFSYVAQINGDLGKRMAHAFNYVFSKGHRQAIIIGTDIPTLTAHILTEAFQLLDQSDIVIGPAYDGGYYLIGMRQLHRELFINIAWSTPIVTKQTLQAIARLRLHISYLPTLMDIDTEEDLRYWVSTSSVPHHFQHFLSTMEK